MKIARAWDRGKNGIRCLVKNPETNRFIFEDVKFDYYFYIDNPTYYKEKHLLVKYAATGLIKKIEEEALYTRIYVDREHNSEFLDQDNCVVWDYNDYTFRTLLKNLAEFNIQTYEADLPIFKRWMIDQKVEIEDEYKVLFTDIETDDSTLSGIITPGEFMIMSTSFVDAQSGKEHWLCSDDITPESEEKFLRQCARVFNAYDIISAWNSTGFDEPYIKARFKKYGIEIDWRKKFWQDFQVIFKKYGPPLPSYSLEEVSQKYIGEGKVQHDEKLIELFNDDKERLKEYNIQDSRLMYKLENKTGLLAIAREVAKIGYCFVDDIHISHKIDMLVLKKSDELNHYHFKTKVKSERTDEDDFEGAFVLEPETGFHEDVFVVDFHAMYVNIVKVLNSSPDTIVDNPSEEEKKKLIRSPNGYYFRKDIMGILPSIITMTGERREHFKALMKTVSPDSDQYKLYDRQQYVFKSYALSFYGVVGMQGSRFFDKRIAESITLTGQYMIKVIKLYIEKVGLKAIYSDTDSLFLVGTNDKEIGNLCKKIKKVCDLVAKEKINSDTNTLEMAFDKKFNTFVLVSKKRYAGMLSYIDGRALPEPKLYVAGLEYKRTDNCEIVRTTQKEVLLRFLEKRQHSPKELSDWLYGLKKRCVEKDLKLEEITFAQKLTKEIESYKADAMHLKVAREMRADGKEVWVSDKIKYVVIGVDKDGKGIPTPIYKYNGRYDPIYYWNKKLYPPIKRVLEAVYKEIDWTKFEIVIPRGVSKRTVVGRSFSQWQE